MIACLQAIATSGMETHPLFIEPPTVPSTPIVPGSIGTFMTSPRFSTSSSSSTIHASLVSPPPSPPIKASPLSSLAIVPSRAATLITVEHDEFLVVESQWLASLNHHISS
jgi:hypothetical protein